MCVFSTSDRGYLEPTEHFKGKGQAIDNQAWDCRRCDRVRLRHSDLVRFHERCEVLHTHRSRRVLSLLLTVLSGIQRGSSVSRVYSLQREGGRVFVSALSGLALEILCDFARGTPIKYLGDLLVSVFVFLRYFQFVCPAHLRPGGRSRPDHIGEVQRDQFVSSRQYMECQWRC